MNHWAVQVSKLTQERAPSSKHMEINTKKTRVQLPLFPNLSGGDTSASDKEVSDLFV